MRVILAATLAIAPLIAEDSEPAERLDEAAAVFAKTSGTGSGHPGSRKIAG